ncbi:MAG: helicase associated domain-containing protein, partial [Clostridia bacterium]|nr:helicase associated domain-containing protein [Clostridia bacterium]
ETINQLEDMGIEWAYDRFSAIRAYYKEFGTLEGINSKTIYEHNGKQVNLHNTIYMLRQNYKNGTLSQEVIDEFTSMGMIWSIKMQYEDKVTMFKQYCLDGGALKDISKTTIYHYNGRDIKMGEIVSDLREKYANKELPEDIVAQLNDIGMVWSVRPRINADKMDLFRAYFSEYGTLADIKSSTKYTYQGREICLG